MFVGFSEISINVIVKHVQNIGIIRALSLPGGLAKFLSAWRDRKKIPGLWFTKEDQYRGWHYVLLVHGWN